MFVLLTCHFVCVYVMSQGKMGRIGAPGCKGDPGDQVRELWLTSEVPCGTRSREMLKFKQHLSRLTVLLAGSRWLPRRGGGERTTSSRWRTGLHLVPPTLTVHLHPSTHTYTSVHPSFQNKLFFCLDVLFIVVSGSATLECEMEWLLMTDY